MMISNFTVCLVLALVCLHNALNTECVFTFNWFSGQCIDFQGCDESILNRWDHQSFAIQGFWCVETNHQFFGEFDLEILKTDPVLLDHLYHQMPTQRRLKEDYTKPWAFQWKDHGHDYVALLLQLFPEEYSLDIETRNKQLQLAFFRDLVKIYESYPGIRKVSKPTLNVSELSQLLGVSSDSVTYSCVDDTNILRQIKLCFKRTTEGMIPDACGSRVGNLHCIPGTTELALVDWKRTKQINVFEGAAPKDYKPLTPKKSKRSLKSHQ